MAMCDPRCEKLPDMDHTNCSCACHEIVKLKRDNEHLRQSMQTTIDAALTRAKELESQSGGLIARREIDRLRTQVDVLQARVKELAGRDELRHTIITRMSKYLRRCREEGRRVMDLKCELCGLESESVVEYPM